MKQLNKEPISWHGEKLIFFATTYVVDNSLAIVCETLDEEPFATLTVNLSDYGILYPENWVVLHHDIPDEFKFLFIDNFGTGNVMSVRYGYASSIAMELNQETVEKIKKG